ncbi:MAG: ABC transporter ATP-binding protein [Bacteroidales bacterium]|nr:ABC transporter ATP-binding protein [Bacteroidales bacterium]
MKLQIQHLSKTYSNGIQALKNIDLTIGNGLFGLLGPNGAGKSTLMRTIATLQEPDTGSVHLDELNVLTKKHEVRKLLGYLPQEFGTYKNISAEEMLNHIAILKGITDKKVRRALTHRLLDQTNLFGVRNKKLGSYSGGMKQRFGVAQALLGNPKILIVDEPTAGLDPAERKRFLNMLSELGEQIIVILSTHIVDDVEEICSNMSIIDKGVVKYTGRPLDALETLRGRVWKKTVTKMEESQFDETYRILSSRLADGMIEIHVFSDNNPGVFEKTKPVLEDVYFAAIKNYLPFEA